MTPSRASKSIANIMRIHHAVHVRGGSLNHRGHSQVLLNVNNMVCITLRTTARRILMSLYSTFADER